MSYLLSSQRTTFLRDQDIQKDWILVDAQEKVLGRLATSIVHHLRGKHKPSFATHQNVGDFVVVVNASKIVVSGKKMDQKKYHQHSLYPGGLKTLALKEKMEKDPAFALRTAVKRMLPSGPMGRKLLRQLFVYPDDKHPHQAQKPVVLDLGAKIL